MYFKLPLTDFSQVLSIHGYSTSFSRQCTNPMTERSRKTTNPHAVGGYKKYTQNQRDRLASSVEQEWKEFAPAHDMINI